MDVQRRAHRDEGFTLMELMIVLLLLGVVLSAIYAAAFAMMHGGQVNETQAVFAKESGESIRIIEKYLMQLTRIEAAGQNAIQFITDHDLNGQPERIAITANASSQLRYEVWLTNSSLVNQTKVLDTVFSSHAANVARGVPLFTYLDVNGTPISTSDPNLRDNARSIRFELLLSYNGMEQRVNKTVYLRNQGN